MEIDRIMPTKKCKYCNKSFTDYTEYRLNEKLKRHTQDIHFFEINSQKVLDITSIPRDELPTIVSNVFRELRI
jgi:hypothetical protein